MERNAVLWSRTLKPGREPCTGTAVVGASGALEGYVLTRTENRGHEAELLVRDLVARTPQAATRLLTFLADHRTTLQAASWFGSAADPLLALRAPFQLALRAAFGDEWANADPVIRRSDRADYQADVALGLAKKLGRPPRDVATALLEHLDLRALCSAVEIAGPGFINLTLRSE
jgi:hypothetical protein